MVRRFIVLTFLSLYFQAAHAQKPLRYAFQYLNQSDGLLHNDVLAVSQDSKGFIWIATPNGLQRYDGSAFAYFPDMLGNGAAGYANGIEISYDHSANLFWVNNYSSVEAFDPVTHQFRIEPATTGKAISFSTTQDSLSRKATWSIFAHALVLSVDDPAKTSSIFYNSFRAGVPHSAYYSTDSASGMTWFGNSTGIKILDHHNGQVYSTTYNPLSIPLLQPPEIAGKNWLRFLMLDNNQNLWLSSWDDQLCRYNIPTGKLSAYSLRKIVELQQSKPSGKPLVNCMMEDDHHQVWIGTEGAGLLRYDATNDNFDFAKLSGSGPRYIFKIFNLFQDREHNIWVATDNGISIFNPYQSRLHHHPA